MGLLTALKPTTDDYPSGWESYASAVFVRNNAPPSYHYSENDLAGSYRDENVASYLACRYGTTPLILGSLLPLIHTFLNQ